MSNVLWPTWTLNNKNVIQLSELATILFYVEDSALCNSFCQFFGRKCTNLHKKGFFTTKQRKIPTENSNHELCVNYNVNVEL